MRRLLDFLAQQREEKGSSLVITTHSPICIDWAGKREDSTILHVRREEGRTICQNVEDYGGQASILDDLDVRGSDLLQANGVIWVEGPSDRIYIRKWIELVSEGELIEDDHYCFMYYGGNVLSHFDALHVDEMNDKIKMLLINRNVAVVIDSDHQPNPKPDKKGKARKPRLTLGTTKKRLIEEVNGLDGFSWVTEGKEVENYIPNNIWDAVAGIKVAIVDQYTVIPDLEPIAKIPGSKVELAHKVEPHIDDAALDILDLRNR